MKKRTGFILFTIFVFGIVTSESITGSAGQDEEPTDTSSTGESSKNNCTANSCGICGNVGDYKSCGLCHKSYRELIFGKTDVYECKHPHSIQNCEIYYQTTEELAKFSGCKICSSGYTPVEEITIQGVTRYKCVEPEEEPVSNCQFYIIVEVEETKKTSCVTCKEGFYLDVNLNQCKELDKSNTIQFCQFQWKHENEIQCLSCHSGYMLNDSTCVEWTDTSKGCSTAVNNKCTECATLHRYYATDYSDSTGQVCTYSSKIVFFEAILIFIALMMSVRE